MSLTSASTAARSTSVAEAHLDATGAAEYTFDLHWDLPRLTSPPVRRMSTRGSIAAILEPGASSVLETLRAAREQATISYDPNLRPNIMGDLDHVRERVEEIIGLADIVKASDEDLAALYHGQAVPEVLRRWAELGPPGRRHPRRRGVVFGLTTGELASAPTVATGVVDRRRR